MPLTTLPDRAMTWTGFLTARVPAGWVASEEDGVITIHAEDDGVGVLQISFVNCPADVVADDTENVAQALLDALDLPRTTPMEQAAVGGALGVYFDGQVDGTFWRAWHFGRGRRVCRVTYICEVDDARVEKDLVSYIVGHLVLES